MFLHLLSQDHKIIGSLVIVTATKEVYTKRGDLLGVLPSGQIPNSPEEIVSSLQKPKKEEKVHVPVKEEKKALGIKAFKKDK